MCAHGEIDSESSEPFEPAGTLDGKVVDSKMAKQMSFSAKWGSACDISFDAKDFLKKHPQYEWMNGMLKDRPAQPWTIFKAGESK